MASLLSRVVSNIFRSTSRVAAKATTTTTTTTTTTIALQSCNKQQHQQEQQQPAQLVTHCFDFDNHHHQQQLESSLDEDSFELVSNDMASSIAGFAKHDVLRLAHLADEVYKGPLAMRKALPHAHTFATHAAQGFVLARGKQVEIVFKGTSTLYDAFVTDLNGLPAFVDDLLPSGCGFLHAGFLAAFRTAWPQLLAIIESHCEREGLASMSELERVTMAGHSLGAALATVCALHLAHHVRSTVSAEAWEKMVAAGKVRVCTFGSPRVMSRQAAGFYNEVVGLGAHTLRVAQNGFDPVTMVHGSVGFRHVGLNLALDMMTSSSLLLGFEKAYVPHVMGGYKAGVERLGASSFVATHQVGVRRRLVHACLSLLRASVLEDHHHDDEHKGKPAAKGIFVE